jgi:sialate O-acetylesterase
MHAVSLALDWKPADTKPDGTWAMVLRRVPRGGLYRIETSLNLDETPVEWSTRGDMVHHVGVGDVWVIAGQSNSAGYGKSPAHDAPELGVHMFHASGEWRLATHPLADSTGTQYPPNREGANGSHSPYLEFGRKLKNLLGYPIGLIPAALGGSPLSMWNRKENGVLFENMLEYIRDAGGRCRGMLWYQGCSDAGPAESATYLARFSELVADLRGTLGDPALPVITVQLNRHIGTPRGVPGNDAWDVVREAQRQAALRLPGVQVISTLDLGLSDGIHNNSSANLVIGQRMADAALGGVYGREVKHLHPDLREARKAGEKAIELTFGNIDERLSYENAIADQVPFLVRDTRGVVPLAGWELPSRDVLRLLLERPIEGAAVVVGAPGAYPPSMLPMDICGFRPMLAFTAAVTS